VISRHEVGNVGPTLRSLILKYWQCGPELQRPACRSCCSSLQTVAMAPSVVEARGLVALVANMAAASRSAALIVILFNIYRVPCRLRVGDVQVFERMAPVVTRGGTSSAPMRGCITAIASIAYRYFQNGVVLRTDGANRTQSTDPNDDQFTRDGFYRALGRKPPRSNQILDCSSLLPTGYPTNLADNRVGQRCSPIPHSCRRRGAA
jgi:hypothetical protein